MTRRIVYGMGLWATAAVTAMTLASIVMPNWIRWNNGTETSPKFTYGLHKRCSSVTGQCEPFPTYADCHRDQSFCGMWRSVGFLMSFAVLLELATLVAYIIIILGGQQLRHYGWKVVVSLLAAIVLAQCSGMAIIAYLFDHDERFFPGWQLDTSWILCTVSWTVALVTGAGMCTAVYALPEEGGYELIPDDYQAYIFATEERHFGRAGIQNWMAGNNNNNDDE